MSDYVLEVTINLSAIVRLACVLTVAGLLTFAAFRLRRKGVTK